MYILHLPFQQKKRDEDLLGYGWRLCRSVVIHQVDFHISSFMRASNFVCVFIGFADYFAD